MMNSGVRAAVLLGGLLAIGAAPGCGRGASVRLTSLKDPYFPEEIEFAAHDCVHHTEPGRDVRVLAYRSGPLGEAAQGTEQWLELRLFWRPDASRTPVNNTAIDATVRLVVASSAGVLVYAGTGWVYPGEIKPDRPLTLEIETGQLHLESRSGEIDDFLGDARVAGKLRSKSDGAAAIGLLRDMELATLRATARE